MSSRSLTTRITITAIAVTAGALIAAIVWLASSSGLAWVSQKIMRAGGGTIQATGIEGSLLSEVRIRQLRISNDELRIEGDAIALRWKPAALVRGKLALDSLTAATVRYRNLSTTPSTLPASLTLPLEVSIDALELGRLEIDGLPAITDLKVGFTGGRKHHAIRLLQTQSEGWRIEGAVQINANSPFETSGRIQATRGTSALAMQAGAGISGTLEEVKIDLKGSGRGTSIQSLIVVRPYERQPLKQLDAQAIDLDLSAWNSEWPLTRITAAAAAQTTGQILAGSLQLKNAASGPLDSRRIPLTAVDARFSGSGNDWKLPALDIRIGRDGRLTGIAAIQAGNGRMDLRIGNIDSASIDSRLRSIRISGNAKLSGNAGTQSVSAKLDGAGLQLQISANHAGEVISIERAQLQAGNGLADIKGKLELNAANAFDFSGILSRFDPSKLAAVPSAILNGSVTANGRLNPDWQANIHIDLAESRWRNLPFSATAAFTSTKHHWFDGIARVAAGRNAIEVKGGYGKPKDQLHWMVDAGDLRALDPALGGRISSSGTVTGTPDGPALDFLVQAQQLAAGTRKVESFEAKGLLGAGTHGPLQLSATATNLQLADRRIETLRLNSNGTRARHVIEGSARGADGSGSLRATGGMDARRHWTGSIDQLEFTKPWPLRLSAPAQIIVGTDTLVIEQLRATLLDGEFGPAALRAEKGRITTSGNFRNIAAGRLLGRDSGLVDGSLRLGGQWTLTLNEAWTGTAGVYRESGDLSLSGDTPVPLGLRKAQLSLNAADSGIDLNLDVDSSAMGTAAGRLQTRLLRRDGAWMLPGEAALAGNLNVDFRSMAWLRPLLPAIDRVDGRMTARIRLDGTVAAPRFSGTINGDQFQLRAVGPGLDLRDGRLRATLDDTQFRLEEFEFKAGKGRVLANGTADLSGGLRSVELTARAEHAQILLAPQWSATIDGNGRLGLRDRRITLEGKFGLEEGRYDPGTRRKPALDDDVVVRNGKPAPTEKTASFPIDLNIAIDLQDKLAVRGNGLDALLGGSIRVSSRGAGLSAIGDVRTVRGHYTVFGQQLDIERGTVAFAGPLTNPGLDLRAIRKFQTAEVGVEVSGSLQRPTVKLVSVPDMSDTDRLGWLALGRDPSGSDRAQLAVLQAAVLGLTGSGGKPIQKQIAEGVGLDEIGFAGGENGAMGVVALGKKLTDQLSIRLEQTLGGTAGSLLRMDYMLSERWRLRGTAGAENAGDILFTIRFD